MAGTAGRTSFFSSILSRKKFCLSFFVIRIDRVNSPQFPSVVESCLVSVLPILVFSILSGFTNLRP